MASERDELLSLKRRVAELEETVERLKVPEVRYRCVGYADCNSFPCSECERVEVTRGR